MAARKEDYDSCVLQGVMPMTTRLALTSAALQDHITKKLLLPSLSLSGSGPLWKSRRKSSTKIKNGLSVKEEDLGKEREYELDNTQTPLTLAERMGLVAGPVERLTEEQWSLIKVRSVQQRESIYPCAICKEEFHLKPQVLLSCSHVFHRACVQAFEKFSRQKSCPVCRRQQYKTRVIHDAANLFRHQCATRIQAWWRGYTIRKWYTNAMKTRCPKEKLLRQRFFEEKLQELNDSFVQYCHTDTEAFLSDIDHSLSSSRQVFDELERRHMSMPKEHHWDRIQSQVIQRGVWDCPICLTALHTPSLTERDEARYAQHRRCVLLSCSHVFHHNCLQSFETLTTDSQLSCPLCRSVYHKKLL
ncbi:RING finger protein 32 [Boleophthalmus pectinirostris]|uniref:RING finger protein 32 n=1 Tax=Boleophthalmus pectinirostris TaxID=150288 RepID=UPI0024327145|nr:RING finger protein 32 [Boleophthalmus pectinirostris]